MGIVVPKLHCQTWSFEWREQAFWGMRRDELTAFRRNAPFHWVGKNQRNGNAVGKIYVGAIFPGHRQQQSSVELLPGRSPFPAGQIKEVIDCIGLLCHGDLNGKFSTKTC